MTDIPDLDTLRATLERVDEEILDALQRRMDLADDMARAKLAAAWPFRDPQRGRTCSCESCAAGRRRAGLDPHEIERLYRVILDMSVARQQSLVPRLDTTPLRVGYLGVEGSYSHLAARQRYAGRSGRRAPHGLRDRPRGRGGAAPRASRTWRCCPSRTPPLAA